jgi:putative ABC transport system substrate-binding protein
MRRREVITLISSAAAWPLAARAQQGGRLMTLGYLGPGPSEPDTQRVNALVARLCELGWIEGRNLTIEYRWAHNRAERFREIPAELIRLKVDVIVTLGSVVPAIKPMTSVIPVVFAVDADPVGRGLVESLARPGGNITGLSVQSIELVGKRLEILREITPQARRLGVLANAGFLGAMQEAGAVQVAAVTLSLEPILAEMKSKQDTATAFDKLAGRVDALYVCGDPLAGSNRYQINAGNWGAIVDDPHDARICGGVWFGFLRGQLPGPVSARR